MIVDWSNKVALIDQDEIFMECRVDANPRAEISWTGPNGESLNTYAEEKMIKSNQISSELHCNPFVLSLSIIFNRYRFDF